MGKQRRTYEIRYRTMDGKNGGQGATRSFRAVLTKGTVSEAQKKCHRGTVVGVRKVN